MFTVLRSLSEGCQKYDFRTHTVGRADCQACLSAVCTNKTPASIQVTDAPAGTIIGTRDSNSFRSLGIPCTHPPVGALRFRPPEHAAPFTSAHDARQFGAVCPQETGTDARVNRAAESEDCLFLNVPTYTAADSRNTAAPSFFEPGNLVSYGRVVVVTFNCCLGLLGLLENTPIIPRSTLPGDLFLLDQILALQWVQANIAAFGGDPGQQSDAIGTPFHEESTTAGIMGAPAMETLKCTDLPYLQALPVEAIVKAQGQVIAHYNDVYVRRVLMLPFMPTVDHDLLATDFYLLAQARRMNPSPHIMWGQTRDENGIVMPSLPVEISRYHAAMLEYYRDDRVARFEGSPYYQPDPSDPDTVRATITRTATGLLFYCPRLLLAEMLPLEQQRNASATPGELCIGDGRVCHFDDVAVAFGNAMSIPGLEQSPDDARFARQVVDRFGVCQGPEPESGSWRRRRRERRPPGRECGRDERAVSAVQYSGPAGARVGAVEPDVVQCGRGGVPADRGTEYN
ncbi:hypothetical protein BG006_006375 [Podila minutissima]|uniref:Carboxylesterase type B domain-containing protein n=1 Tax=Podila minutissima TaxID=64525 RepID=A0A9P5VLD8_9FUNG|nr:hypothetical protein BG006_006375 [Podila minutissima]